VHFGIHAIASTRFLGDKFIFRKPQFVLDKKPVAAYSRNSTGENEMANDEKIGLSQLIGVLIRDGQKIYYAYIDGKRIERKRIGGRGGIYGHLLEATWAGRKVGV
jgi:hypothetical protein